MKKYFLALVVLACAATSEAGVARVAARAPKAAYAAAKAVAGDAATVVRHPVKDVKFVAKGLKKLVW